MIGVVAAEFRADYILFQPTRQAAPSGPKVSKQQMKGGKGGR